jgi:hypothetical protein
MTDNPQEQSPRQPGETDEQYGARLREEAAAKEGQSESDESADE